MTVNGEHGGMFVLRVEIVRWAIDQLLSQNIHIFFPAYLHLQAIASETGRTTDIQPRWHELGALLAMPGGPPGRPFYRPMMHRGGISPWLNANLAGSYAPSSLRKEPAKVVTTNRFLFTLRDRHAELALEHLLYGVPVSAYALAAFFFRDRGFYGVNLSTNSLLQLLAVEFHFNPYRPFPKFITEAIANIHVDDWFEPFDASQGVGRS